MAAPARFSGQAHRARGALESVDEVPACTLLRELLEQAGIDVATVYLTNTVKHFKFERRGNSRRRASDVPVSRRADPAPLPAPAPAAR